MTEQSHMLSAEERVSIARVLRRAEPITVLLWGEGDDRWISFYAEGTRLEARIAYPGEHRWLTRA